MNGINYWNPIGRAWNRMVTVLFRPFNPGKWMTVGFSAFLANCGRNNGSGNGGSGGNSGGQHSESGASLKSGLCDMMERAEDFWIAHSGMIIAASVVIVLLVILLTILINWLNSRGQFMLLDNALKNRGAVAEPWREYKKEAGSLMFFQILFGLAVFCVSIVLLAGILVPGFQMIMAEKWIARSFGIAIGSIGLFVVTGIISGFIGMILSEFVVPLMYQRRLSVRDGFRAFVPLLRQHFWKFVLYGLILFVLSIVIAFAILIGVLLTCCTALLLLIIPYIGTVALLPVFVFRRFIGVEFLKQFGDDYDLLKAFPSEGESAAGVLDPEWIEAGAAPPVD
ncbi:MAG: hypothetical protein WC334_01470 [Kiritimatiellales bacterium]|jgi:hypothetical protein